MSKGIVKKALKLVEIDDEDDSVEGLRKERVKLKKNMKEAKNGGKTMDQIIRDRPSVLEEFRRKQKKDNNYRIMKNQEKLSKIKLNKDFAHNLLKKMGKSEDKESKTQSNSKDDEPFFTEEDFQRYVRSLV